MSKKKYDPNQKWYSISATQDHNSCNRRRWFKKTCKLPTQQSTPTVFGDIGHACCERFLMADAMGRDKTGQPVNVFPAGWMSMKPRFGKDATVLTISEEEGALIKTLINKAVTEGYLIREPGRKIEREFRHDIYKNGKHSIKLIGFIDVDNPNEVLDHKFVKNMNYAMSVKPTAKRAIIKSVQMMTYAMVRYIEGHKGNLFLSLLYYVKDYDNPTIQKRSVEVTEMQVKQYFVDNIFPSMKRMLDIDIKFPKHRVLEWDKVPGPDDPSNECNRHYGKPCPFIGICSGTYTVNQYLAAFGRDISELLKSDKSSEGVSTMNSLIAQCQKEVAAMPQGQPVTAVAPAAVQPVVHGTIITPATVAAQNAGQSTVPGPVTGLEGIFGQQAAPVVETPAVDPAVIPTVMQPDNTAIPVEIVQPASVPVIIPIVETSASIVPAGQQRAPWYNDWMGKGCTACKDNPVQGYSSNRKPCVPCDARNELAGIPTSDAYDVQVDGQGIMVFTLKGAGVPPAVEVQVVAEPAVKTTTIFQPNDAVNQKTVVEPTPAAFISPALHTDVTVDSKLEDLLTPKITPPAKVKGFTLLLGCMPTKGQHNMLNADELMSKVMKDIEVASGKPLNSLNHFDVLNAVEASIVGYIPGLVEEGWTIVAYPTTKGSAMDRLVEGLRIHADTVIAPIGL